MLEKIKNELAFYLDKAEKEYIIGVVYKKTFSLFKRRRKNEFGITN